MVEVLGCKHFSVTEIHVQYNSEILICDPYDMQPSKLFYINLDR